MGGFGTGGFGVGPFGGTNTGGTQNPNQIGQMNAQEILRRVTVELEDVAGDDWTDPDYILGKLSVVGDDIAVRIADLDLNYEVQTVVLPNVAANTTDLSYFQQVGQPLSAMILPKSVEYRLVGENQRDWKTVPNVDKIIDTDTGTGEQGAAVASDDQVVESWTWEGGILKISPASVPLDFRVRFQGIAVQLDNNSAQQTAGMTNIHVYKVCEKICASRGGQTNQMVTYFRDCFNKAIADFEALAVKTTSQNKTTRLGGRRSQGGWFSPFRPPIVG